jgi:Uma2 family endonuclease
MIGMITVPLQPPRKSEAQVFPSLSWEQFEAIYRAFESVPGVKFRYLDGQLEIMTISEEHEDFKSTIARLLETYLDEKQIRSYRRGSPSLGNKEIKALSEPDESYNIGTRKLYPDLVIEVVSTSGGVDKLEGYRRMGVAKVWYWEDGVLDVYHLTGDRYEKLNHSQLFPDLSLDLFCRYVNYRDQWDAIKEFRQALREL